MNMKKLHRLPIAITSALILQVGTAALRLGAQTSGTLDPWTTVDLFKDSFEGASGTCIAADAVGSIYAGGGAGWSGQPGHFIIRKSTDGGATFFTLTDMVETTAGGPCALAADLAGNLYANLSGDGLLKSTDGGGTWSVIAPYQAALAVAPDGTVYIARGDGATGTWITQRSSDGGLTWVTIDSYRPKLGGATAYPHAIALDQQGNVYVAGMVVTSATPGYLLVRRSSNGGPFSIVDSWQPSKGVAAALAIATDANGQVYVAGFNRDDSPKKTVYHFIVRKSTTGVGSFWTVDDVAAPSGFDARATSIAVDSLNGVYVTGYVRDVQTYASNVWMTRKAVDGVHFSTSDSISTGTLGGGVATSGLDVFTCGQSGNRELMVRRLSP